MIGELVGAKLRRGLAPGRGELGRTLRDGIAAAIGRWLQPVIRRRRQPQPGGRGLFDAQGVAPGVDSAAMCFRMQPRGEAQAVGGMAVEELAAHDEFTIARRLRPGAFGPGEVDGETQFSGWSHSSSTTRTWSGWLAKTRRVKALPPLVKRVMAVAVSRSSSRR